MWMLPLGIGVDERSGEAGMRGEVCVRRIAGRGVMALRGEPSGGVDTEEDTDEEPTVYVIPAQPPMRESDGCIVSILSAFLKPAGVPSKSPICQMYVVLCMREVP